MYARSEDEYLSTWNALKEEYSSNEAILYISHQWLKFKHRLISCYTDFYPNLGCRSTSRVEGNHNHLKNGENLIRNDLFSVYKTLHLLLENQFVELNSSILGDQLRIQFKFQIKAFEEINYKISNFALEKVLFDLLDFQTV